MVPSSCVVAPYPRSALHGATFWLRSARLLHNNLTCVRPAGMHSAGCCGAACYPLSVLEIALCGLTDHSSRDYVSIWGIAECVRRSIGGSYQELSRSCSQPSLQRPVEEEEQEEQEEQEQGGGEGSRMVGGGEGDMEKEGVRRSVEALRAVAKAFTSSQPQLTSFIASTPPFGFAFLLRFSAFACAHIPPTLGRVRSLFWHGQEINKGAAQTMFLLACRLSSPDCMHNPIPVLSRDRARPLPAHVLLQRHTFGM
eukprot:3933235-Rhodomonas_salina.1